MTLETQQRILFFDGICNLCNTFVDFLIRRQSQPLFYFAPLQGKTAVKVLDSKVREGLGSVVYFRDGRVLFESTAAIWVLVDLGGAWTLMRFFLIVPKFLRNPIYRFIAKNRYKWFGQKQTCRLPSSKEKAFFLS